MNAINEGKTKVEIEWTEEDFNKAVEMWMSGLSSGVIGLELNRSRNSVLGKFHREGVKRPEGVTVKGLVEKKLPKPRQPSLRVKRLMQGPPMVIDMPVVIEYAPAPEGGVEMVELDGVGSRKMCRWMISDTRYCGGGTLPNRSWCPDHYEVVRRKPGQP
jgi:hypothetical protein